MTTNLLQRANEIQSEIESVKHELILWENHTQSNIRAPLVLRLGGSLKHTPTQAFSDFKLACVTELNKRLEELRVEFEQL